MTSLPASSAPPDAPGPGPVDAPPARPRRSPARRLGCALALVIWFLIVLSPCLLFILATQGEIRVGLGPAPGQHARLWLVMEPEARGLGLSTPRVQESGAGVCVETSVRYLLWAGRAEHVAYCECYARPENGGDWPFTESFEGACPAPEAAP